MHDAEEQLPVSTTDTSMGPDDYANTGFSYNYEAHPKPKEFHQEYFLLPQLDNFTQEMCDKGGTVLDLGSGIGSESAFLKEAIPNGQVFSLDISNLGTTSGKVRFHLDQVQGDVTKPPFADNSFDGIHCKDVLVHVQDKYQFIKNVSKLLKDQGLFVLISNRVAYEAIKQYPWNEEELALIAQTQNLELVTIDHTKIKLEDWYNEPTTRSIMTFRKVSK